MGGLVCILKSESQYMNSHLVLHLAGSQTSSKHNVTVQILIYESNKEKRKSYFGEGDINVETKSKFKARCVYKYNNIGLK